MSFGFGVGDFIVCSKLIKSVVQGLSEATGSASEVRSIIDVLTSLDNANVISQLVWDQVEKTPLDPALTLTAKSVQGTSQELINLQGVR